MTHPEIPEADALEQSAEVGPEDELPHGPVPIEADEADVADQQWEVGIDEEEYR